MAVEGTLWTRRSWERRDFFHKTFDWIRQKGPDMKRSRLTRSLAASALAGLLALTPAAAVFSDTGGHWAEDSIAKWSEEYHIIGGYSDGTFRPDDSITRGAFAGILDRFLHFSSKSDPAVFSDVAGTYWEDAILKLHASGVYLGNNGKALSGSSITRQQAVTMIARAFQIESAEEDLPFADEASIASYARGPVSAMIKKGYVDDVKENRFRPTDPITRAEVVRILGNLVDVLVQTTELYAKDTAGNLMINSPEGAQLTDMTIGGDLILAPGVNGAVTLTDVQLKGKLLNFSEIEPAFLYSYVPEPEPEPQTPEEPPQSSGIQPSEIYTPTKTTGETLTYEKRTIPIYADPEPIQVENGDFEWNGDRLEYVGSKYRARFGIDVSAYQNRESANQTIDWDAVREDGVEFAMVRIGLRGTSTGSVMADAYGTQNIDGAMAAGIETGVYFFAQAVTVEEALEEADFVIEQLKGHEIDGPVAYDWEMKDSTYRVYGTSPEMATACAIAFCRRIEDAGYTPMIYAGKYVSYVKYDQGAIDGYLRWYPEYKSEKSEVLAPTICYQMDYWQFSSGCSIAGIGGRVDANLHLTRRK